MQLLDKFPFHEISLIVQIPYPVFDLTTVIAVDNNLTSSARRFSLPTIEWKSKNKMTK